MDRIGRNAVRADRRQAGEEEVSEDEDPMGHVKKGKSKAVAAPSQLQSPLQLRRSLSIPRNGGLGKSSNPIDVDEETNLCTPVGRIGEMSPGRKHRLMDFITNLSPVRMKELFSLMFDSVPDVSPNVRRRVF